MNRNIILVAIGSMLGGVARYLAAFFITKNIPAAFPYGTFAVNVVGCLAIGAIYGLSERYGWFPADLRLFLATGFCGGFTTFSSFSYENILLFQDKDYVTFAIYALLTFASCLAATLGGLTLVRQG